MSAIEHSGVTMMRRWALPRARAGVALLASGLLLSSLMVSSAAAPAKAAQQATNRSGIVCTSDPAGGTSPTFNLSTRAGYINLPDGTTAYMWGYAEGGRPFQHPGPVLCVNEGDTVTVILKNTFTNSSPKNGPAVSIIFPGQENVTANGVPSQPQFNGSTLQSLAQAAQPNGGTVTYQFTASKPGTYLYESGGGARTSGTDLYGNPQIQVRMGLFGALIVRPAGHPDWAYDRADSEFNPTTEFMALLSEIDPFLNSTVLKGTKAFNLNTYHPRYWLINGRGFPDSIADNFASWLPSQPYGSLATIHPNDKYLPPACVTNHTTCAPDTQWDVLNPSPVNAVPSITRYLSVGTEDYPFHPHGNNGTVIARDATPLESAGGQDMSFEKYAVNVGPGQTWDVLFSWRDNEDYSPTNPIPASEPDIQNLEIGMFYSGSAYLGVQEPMPPGISTLNECGEFYIIAHNHALYQITSWGVNMTGPITYTRVDPPLPNSCP